MKKKVEIPVSGSPELNRFPPYLRAGFGWWWRYPSRIRDGGPVPINRYGLLIVDPKTPLFVI